MAVKIKMSMTREELRARAREVWLDYREDNIYPTDRGKSILRNAYYESVLPRDPDFSVAQWVEDCFPDLFF